MHSDFTFPKICSIALMVKEFLIAQFPSQNFGKKICEVVGKKFLFPKTLKIFRLAIKLREE